MMLIFDKSNCFFLNFNLLSKHRQFSTKSTAKPWYKRVNRCFCSENSLIFFQRALNLFHVCWISYVYTLPTRQKIQKYIFHQNKSKQWTVSEFQFAKIKSVAWRDQWSWNHDLMVKKTIENKLKYLIEQKF